MFEHHVPKPHDVSYDPPRKHVLLLSCMDPRLLDDVVDFMNHDNLTNRYDHLILAGAALGALGGPDGKKKHWKKTFMDQLLASIELHKTQDVYILEHRNCGAYEKVFHVHEELSDSESDQRWEYELHRRYSARLARRLRRIRGGYGKPLRVHTFLMDLRGGAAPFIEAPRAPKRRKNRKA